MTKFVFLASLVLSLDVLFAPMRAIFNDQDYHSNVQVVCFERKTVSGHILSLGLLNESRAAQSVIVLVSKVFTDGMRKPIGHTINNINGKNNS